MSRNTVVIILVALALILGGQILLKWVSGKLTAYINNSVDEKHEEGKQYYKHRRFAENTWILTSLIGGLEALAFYSLALYFLHFSQPHPIQSIIPIAGGWLALKGVGNFGAWSDPIYGRAIFYKFLLGSTVNITLAVGLAYLTAWIVHIRIIW